MSGALVGRGFSTVELVIALAILSIVLFGVAAAENSNQYWIVGAQSALTSLEKAREMFETYRQTAATDFYSITIASSTLVTDISSCAKQVVVSSSWQTLGYPTSTESVEGALYGESELLKEGGDCLLNVPKGAWTHPTALQTTNISGNPTDIDTFKGISYLTTDQSPYLGLISSHAISFANGFADTVPLSAIDVARDGAHVYAYIAAATSSKPFQILEVTDPQNPVLLSQSGLQGVTITSTQANGWRVFYYDHSAYVLTRFISGFSPELHVFDVSDPTHPIEKGQYKLSTSAYALIARDQLVSGTAHRFLYLATTLDAKELMVLDVSNSAHITEVTGASCALPGTQQAYALALTGNTLYVGRDAVSNGEELYAFDVSNLLAATSCPPLLGKADIQTDSFSRHIQAIRVSGPLLFLATNNTTNAHGQVQIRNSDPKSNFALLGTYSIPRLSEQGIDLDSDLLYTIATGTPQFSALASP